MPTSRSDALRIVVVGAGMGGLSAALRLAHAGHHVTVLEKRAQPGGMVNLLARDGYRFDTGPTILTMPGEIRRLFRDLGRDPADYLTLLPLDPIYRAHFRDGTQFELHRDEAATLEEVHRLSPRDVDNYRRFMRRTDRIWRAIEAGIFDRLFLSWRDVLHPRVLRSGMQVDALQSMYRRVDRQFHDPRVKQLFMFQAIYVGASPRQTPATFTVIPWLEQQQGVWFPEGGLYRLVEAALELAEEVGIEVRTSAAVAEIRVEGGRARGVTLDSGEFLPAQVVLSNANLNHTYGDLIDSRDRPKYSDDRLARYDPSSSAFILYVAAQRSYPELVHHNIYFSDDYDREMRAIFEEKRLPEAGSWYICTPTRTDPTLAPPGGETLYVLALAPALSSNSPDWQAERAKLVERMLDRMEREAGLADIRAQSRWIESWTPLDFQRAYNSHRGSIFGLSAITRQSAFFRPPNRSEDIRGLYLVGSSTQPGGGVPIVMLGGRLVAELIEQDRRGGRLE